MFLLNGDLMRATRRFDAAGRPLTRDIAHLLQHQVSCRSLSHRIYKVLRAAARKQAQWAQDKRPDGYSVPQSNRCSLSG